MVVKCTASLGLHVDRTALVSSTSLLLLPKFQNILPYHLYFILLNMDCNYFILSCTGIL